MDKRFGKLIATKYIGGGKWLCKCDCGNEKIIDGNNLRHKRTRSCGCLQKEFLNKTPPAKKHGHSPKGKISKTYRAWQEMKTRCNNKNYKRYKDYGGREITICNRWLEPSGQGFLNFLKDMGECPAGLSLDRINNNKLINGYSPENCRWATKIEQAYNTRRNIYITFNGKTQCLSAWSKEYKINYLTLWNRLYVLNWPIKKALTTPTRRRRSSLIRYYENKLRVALRNLKYKNNNKKINFSKYLPYNSKQLQDHLENIRKSQNNYCPMCHKSYNKIKYDIDHIVPTSVAKTKEELLKLFNLENLSLLCYICNRWIKRNNV